MKARVAAVSTPARALALVSDLVALTKPRLSSLVVATTAVGIVVGHGRLGLARAAMVTIATAMLVGCANVLNSYIEREIDARMERTADRPLAAGRLDPRVALWGGIAGGVLIVPVLGLVANPLTALLGAVAFVTYVAIYTPLKQISSLALPVGAIPGAIPPAMGVVAVTGRLDASAWILFGILFAWQLPHFIAISIYLEDDYARGGLQVFARVHGARRSAVIMAASTFALVPVSLAGVWVGMAGLAYGAVAAVLGAAFFGLALASAVSRDVVLWSRWTFRASLAYLVFLLVALSASAG